jgi:serine/threonine protein kinase
MSETTQVWKDRYEIERPLGRGGMSAVFLAKDRQLLSKSVVVKVLLEEITNDAWMQQKFKQEMEALARIDHPGVVGVLDTGTTPEGKPFLVMQYVEGDTLRNLMDQGPMEFTRAAKIVRQVAQALGAAHEKGVWHRDLKPENIMLQHSGGEDYIKLIDFGIAGIQNSQFTGEATKVAGTLTYMAPEQFAGNPCAASDTYALGVVAYEMLTGRTPFPSSSMTHLVQEGLTWELPRRARPDLPEAAERAILKAVSFRAEQRQASIRELGDDLFSALTGGQAPRKASSGELEIAHVLFTDLVGYSLLTMDKQREYLAELQGIVRQSASFRKAEKNGDIISLPTGDGMALSFFGDPLQPVQCSVEVAKELKSKPHLKLRMGIHTGPVYRISDVNANANVAGGGINMAQRVMDSGDAGHILLSKTVADVLLQLSAWAPYVSDLGEHAVKHGVKLHIYSLATEEAGNAETPAKFKAAAAAKAAPPAAAPAAEPAKSKKTPLIAAVAAVVLLGGGGAAWMAMQKPEPLSISYSTINIPDGRIAFNVANKKPGYLYILNYGPDKGQMTFLMLEPRYGRSAQRSADESKRVPEEAGFQPDTAEEKNTPYLVWSAEQVPEMEALKKLPGDHGQPNISDQSQVANTLQFLKNHHSEATGNAASTDLRTNDKVLVYPISLEKH